MANDLTKGAIFLLLGELLLAVMAAMIKHAAQDVPHEMLVFTRNLFGLLALLPIVAHQGIANLKTTRLGGHFQRALVGLTAMYGYFYVIAHLPLAEAVLVKLSAPFFLPIIGFLWLKERITVRTVLAIIIGFVGVVFVLRPGADTFQPVALIGVAAALLAALAKVTIRDMADTEPTYRVVFYFGVIATLVSAVPLLWGWQTPGSLQIWLWLALIGVAGTVGQMLMTYAYQIANPGQIGPYTYSAVIYAAIMGWLFWGEALLLTTAIGSVLIVVSGVLNMKKT